MCVLLRCKMEMQKYLGFMLLELGRVGFLTPARKGCFGDFVGA